MVTDKLEMDRTKLDWFEYHWRTYRGRVALARRWHQPRNCAWSDLILGIKLTNEEILAYKKGVKQAFPIGKNIRNYYGGIR